jgi:hypothetical protein
MMSYKLKWLVISWNNELQVVVTIFYYLYFIDNFIHFSLRMNLVFFVNYVLILGKTCIIPGLIFVYVWFQFNSILLFSFNRIPYYVCPGTMNWTR